MTDPSADGAPSGDPADEEYVDELPEDLNLEGFVGPHTFPNNDRRRIPAVLYLLFGVVCILLYATRADASPLVNTGILWAGIGLGLFGLYGLVAGRTLKVEESDALVTASVQVGFPVGHAAAQMVWRGWMSRPTWRILLYSDENPPANRGIVLVDGLDGHVVEWFAEENPEDWRQLEGSAGPVPEVTRRSDDSAAG
jgi:hypothetical protein